MKIRYFTKILKALSDPSRLRLIKILSEKELCVCEIEAVMDMKQATVSQQLRRLKEADLVNERKNGWWKYYSLNRENLNKFIDSFKGFMDINLGELEEFEDYDERYSTLCENPEIIKCKNMK